MALHFVEEQEATLADAMSEDEEDSEHAEGEAEGHEGTEDSVTAPHSEAGDTET